jgi:uncharacterized protein with HEPN domain
MSRHDDRIRMRHMLDRAVEAVSLLRGRSREELDRDRMLELSLVRLVEIVGEAARCVAEETQIRNPAIPWRQIVGMRNRLIHGYDRVDLQILWDTIQDDLPPLIQALEISLEDTG